MFKNIGEKTNEHQTKSVWTKHLYCFRVSVSCYMLNYSKSEAFSQCIRRWH